MDVNTMEADILDGSKPALAVIMEIGSCLENLCSDLDIFLNGWRRILDVELVVGKLEATTNISVALMHVQSNMVRGIDRLFELFKPEKNVSLTYSGDSASAVGITGIMKFQRVIFVAIRHYCKNPDVAGWNEIDAVFQARTDCGDLFSLIDGDAIQRITLIDYIMTRRSRICVICFILLMAYLNRFDYYCCRYFHQVGLGIYETHSDQSDSGREIRSFWAEMTAKFRLVKDMFSEVGEKLREGGSTNLGPLLGSPVKLAETEINRPLGPSENEQIRLKIHILEYLYHNRSQRSSMLRDNSLIARNITQWLDTSDPSVDWSATVVDAIHEAVSVKVDNGQIEHMHESCEYTSIQEYVYAYFDGENRLKSRSDFGDFFLQSGDFLLDYGDFVLFKFRSKSVFLKSEAVSKIALVFRNRTLTGNGSTLHYTSQHEVIRDKWAKFSANKDISLMLSIKVVEDWLAVNGWYHTFIIKITAPPNSKIGFSANHKRVFGLLSIPGNVNGNCPLVLGNDKDCILFWPRISPDPVTCLPLVVRELDRSRAVDVFVSRNGHGKRIVIKALHLPKHDSDSHAAKLERNTDRLVKLNHENIVRHYACFRGRPIPPDGIPRFYITMEYCSGGTLRDAVRGKPPERDLFTEYMKDTLRGLAYLYEEKIVHRDLKSDNILLGFDPSDGTTHLKIGDLGDFHQLATDVTRQNEVSDEHGTPSYMSPELINSALGGNVGRKTDIWSFGCVLTEMLTGKAPQFPADHDANPILPCQSIMYYVANGGRPRIPRHCPEWIFALIDSCLQRNPEDRPTAHQLLESVLCLTDSRYVVHL